MSIIGNELNNWLNPEISVLYNDTSSDELLAQAQRIIDANNDNPREMIDNLWKWYEENEDAGIIPRGWLMGNTGMVTVNLYHGTRSKASPDEIKRVGLCSFSIGEVDKYIDAAANVCKVELDAGPRICKWIDRTVESLKQQYSGRNWEFINKKPSIYLSYDGNASCSWAFRNPEIVHDVFYWRTPTTIMDKILGDNFGTPKRVKVRTRVMLGDLVGSPQNINSGRNCITPDEILEVQECSHADVVKSYGGWMPKYMFDGGQITDY